MKMKNIYSAIAIAFCIATFSGCNEDSTPAATSQPVRGPVAQPGSAVRQGANDQASQDANPASEHAEQPSVNVTPEVQVEDNSQSEESANIQVDSSRPLTAVTHEDVSHEVKDESAEQSQTSETLPVTTAEAKNLKDQTECKKSQKEQSNFSWLMSFFDTKFQEDANIPVESAKQSVEVQDELSEQSESGEGILSGWFPVDWMNSWFTTEIQEDVKEPATVVELLNPKVAQENVVEQTSDQQTLIKSAATEQDSNQALKGSEPDTLVAVPTEVASNPVAVSEDKPQTLVLAKAPAPTEEPSIPKASGRKYKLAEGEEYRDIDDLDGEMALASDLDLSHGEIYFHCDDAQGRREDFLTSKAKYEEMKLDGYLTESKDGDVTLTAEDDVGGQEIQLACQTLSRSGY